MNKKKATRRGALAAFGGGKGKNLRAVGYVVVYLLTHGFLIRSFLFYLF
jgi:hypothetical protein